MKSKTRATREEIKVADKIIEFDMWVEGTIDNKKILVLSFSFVELNYARSLKQIKRAIGARNIMLKCLDCQA